MRLRAERRAHLERMQKNAEVLADFLVTGQDRGLKRVVRAWRRAAAEGRAARAAAIVRLQCAARRMLARRRFQREWAKRETLRWDYEGRGVFFSFSFFFFFSFFSSSF